MNDRWNAQALAVVAGPPFAELTDEQGDSYSTQTRSVILVVDHSVRLITRLWAGSLLDHVRRHMFDSTEFGETPRSTVGVHVRVNHNSPYFRPKTARCGRGTVFALSRSRTDELSQRC